MLDAFIRLNNALRSGARLPEEALTPTGRRIIEQKLTDLHEQYGIEIEYVNPAYSSQTCSACDYVDKKNRNGEHFECRWCGRTMHADVNASRNLRTRRSRPAGLDVWPLVFIYSERLRAQPEKTMPQGEGKQTSDSSQ